jgi:hypothetical protein
LRAETELFAAIAAQTLAALDRPYPHHLVHLLNGDAEARTPRELHPAFCGSFDWHSAVHGHWCLARLVRLQPEAEFAAAARARLARSLTPENLAAEISYLRMPGREGFERPYGLAWILELGSEVGEVLALLEALAAERLVRGWEILTVPVRSGEHTQTAFSMGLAWDWARRSGSESYVARLRTLARRFYGNDRDAAIAYDLSAADFLSPILAEADVMRRMLEPGAFAAWLEAFLPDLESAAVRAWLAPVRAVDRADGKLSHWDGLNLSRAWMLEAIAEALPPSARADRLADAGRRHREAGLAACLSEHFAGAHWLGSFAVYLLTRADGWPA